MLELPNLDIEESFGSYIQEDIDDWVNTGWTGNFNLDMVLSYAIQEKASDIHIECNTPVCFTKLGDIEPKPNFAMPDTDIMNMIVINMLSHESMGMLIKDLEYDTSYKIRKGQYKGRRFRVNIGKSFDNYILTFRVIEDNIPSLSNLDISQDIRDMFGNYTGVVLVCGATGSGKALYKDTLIPSLNGDTTIKEVNIGDTIFDKYGKQCIVTDKYNPDSKRFFKITIDNEEIKAADNHLWEIYIGENNKPCVVDTISLFYIINQGNQVYIDYNKPCEYNKIDLDINGYILGRLLVNHFRDKQGYTENDINKYRENLLKTIQADISTKKDILQGIKESLCCNDMKRYNAYNKGVTLQLSLNEFEYNCLYRILKSLGYKVNLIKKNYNKDKYDYLIRYEKPLEKLRVDRIVEIKDDKKDYYCIAVNSPTKTFLCTSSYIVTHNTTTLASIIRDIQLNEKKKIITVEKPIEFVYPNDGQSLVVQRDVPTDCLSFGNGLTSAMRSAPNIILIGEARNRLEIDEVLRASETGHLAVTTIHTSNNITTLNRIRSLYTGEEQKRILSSLGDNLRGIINQTLVKSKDGNSRFALREVLKVDFNIRKLIQDDRLTEIRKMQESNRSTMEHLLLQAVLQQKCSLNDARDKAPDQSYFDYLYKQLKE